MVNKMRPTSSGNVYAYIRVSTVQQSLEGESLAVQQRQIAGYVQMLGRKLDRVFTERGVSGTKALSTRSEGAKLLAALQPGDTVICTKLDRMFRSALDALNVATKLKRDGVALHLLDLGGDINNGLGKTFFIIASAFAEAETDRTRERIAEVKRDQRSRGRYLGGRVPFGYIAGPDGALVENVDQQKAIRRMLRLRAQGHSLREIRNKLRSDGVTLSHAAVRLVLRRQERHAAARSSFRS